MKMSASESSGFIDIVLAAIDSLVASMNNPFITLIWGIVKGFFAKQSNRSALDKNFRNAADSEDTVNSKTGVAMDCMSALLEKRPIFSHAFAELRKSIKPRALAEAVSASMPPPA